MQNTPCRQVRSFQLLTVAAFAVYAKEDGTPEASKLSPGTRSLLRAWLILRAKKA